MAYQETRLNPRPDYSKRCKHCSELGSMANNQMKINLSMRRSFFFRIDKEMLARYERFKTPPPRLLSL